MPLKDNVTSEVAFILLPVGIDHLKVVLSVGFGLSMAARCPIVQFSTIVNLFGAPSTER